MTTLSNAHGNNMMDASLGTASYTATTTPLKVRLMTVNGSASANGTQVTGGTYAAQTVTFASATGQSATSNIAVNFTGIVAGTVIVGLELWDSAGTPVRKHFGPLNSSKTVGADGLFSIASGGIVASFA